MLQSNLNIVNTSTARDAAFNRKELNCNQFEFVNNATCSKSQSDTKNLFSNESQASQTNPEKQSELPAEQNNDALRPKVMRKMINLFFTENKYSKDELAILLNIKPEELDQLINQENNSVEIAKKINLFLIKLYCKTKWD